MSHTEFDIQSLKGVAQDNRQVKAGYLFAALQGEHSDGRDYIDDALERGATVILSDEDVPLPETSNVVVIIDEEPRKAFSHIVAEFYKEQPKHILAVGGTNGKTSVAYFVNQLWTALGKKSFYYGTISGTMTTLPPVLMHEMLAELSEDGVTHVALEASSQGLEQYRMDGVRVNIAAFTSFSQDHLDYHISMDAYLAAKLRLFSDLLADDGVAVLNADIPEYEPLLSICQARGVRVLSYGEKGEDIKLVSRQTVENAQDIKIEIAGQSYAVSLPLVGQFQVMNALCALACVLAQDSENAEELTKLLSKLEPVPGRLQVITNGTLHAYVDYAHTPDALENVLAALRPHTKGRLLCVFGCGGDRDTTKRAVMGEIVSRLADVAIVTDDNPRSENPAAIRKEVLSQMDGKAHEIADRHEAIEFAVQQMNQNDILLVAGKGHEQGQTFDGVTHPFDDVCEVNNALRNVV
ncbi:MAG: UDP-N-acetylmuramoyl-L-alanyl-D-glutamate--2,6-diaminopimelate ligase [Alphaproteobacteria bacterium]|nr:MAG: UDP-N-acetylmuramoyl-L-alanyl-D-glutamate--2,6-diaminopimelate ligase [Alphaproteobacteria bacterium]